MSATINPYRLFTGAFIPKWLLGRPEVAQGSKLAYGILALHADPDTGASQPTGDEVGDELGVVERQARRYIDELVGHGLIEVERRGLGQPNIYRFLRHPWMGLDGDAEDLRDDLSDDLPDALAQGLAGVGSKASATETQSQSADIYDHQERTHMSGQERTHMSGQERTHMSTPPLFRRSEIRRRERDLSRGPLTGHALSIFEQIRDALPGAPDGEARRWAQAHQDDDPATIAAVIEASRGRAYSTAYLDACLARGVAPASSASAGTAARERPSSGTYARIEHDGDGLGVLPGETFEAYAERQTGRPAGELAERVRQRVERLYADGQEAA